ncbi:MAG TPA: beta-propeller fold lactonase family protein [Chloroflexota bacterium]
MRAPDRVSALQPARHQARPRRTAGRRGRAWRPGYRRSTPCPLARGRATPRRPGGREPRPAAPRAPTPRRGGRFLYAANQDSDNLVVFRVDTATGGLTPTGHRVQVGTPSCVLFR